MANVIRNGGLRGVRVHGPLVTCVHASDDSVRLGIGDPVKPSGASAKIGNGPYAQTVALCASGDRIFGVVEGFDPLIPTADLSKRYVPASTAQYVLVRVVNPSEDIFAITEDGTLATASVGMCADITGNGGGTTVTECSTTSGLSTVQLDTSTAQAGTGQLKIIGFEDKPDNTPASANSSILVMVNESNVVGVGADGV